MKPDRLTSEEMDQLLLKLGFRLFPSKGPQRVFENPEYDAVLLLPPAGKEPFARLEHLMTLRKTVVEKGIADEGTFETLLNEVRQRSSESMATAS